MLEAIISKIPAFTEYAFVDLEISKLSGYTNKNYLVNTPKQAYVLRIPQQRTNAFIDREAEAHNADTAYQLGIAPEYLWREEDNEGKFTGVSLSIFIKNYTPSTPNILQDPNNLKFVAEALATLQQCKIQGKQQCFKGILDKQRMFELLKKYYQRCDKSQQQKLAGNYQKALQTLGKLADSIRPFVPSHIDLCPENILLQYNSLEAHPPTFTRPNLWIIDWEYSAMASPYWDIASVLNSAELDIESSKPAQEFVQSIFDTDESSFNNDDLAIVSQYQLIIKTLNACWAAVFVN